MGAAIRRLTRCAIVVAALATWAPPAQAALAVVQCVAHTTGDTASSVALTVSALGSGNLVVVGVQVQNGGGTVTVADSGGSNSYQKTTNSPKSNGGSNWEYIFYAKNTTSGPTTVTVTNSGGVVAYFTAMMCEVSGADTTAPFVMDSTGSGSATAVAAGTLTLSGTSSFLFQQAETDAGSISAFGSGYTGYSEDSVTNTSGFIHAQQKITATNEAPTMTAGSASAFGTIAAAFKVAGGAAAPTVCQRLLLGVGGC